MSDIALLKKELAHVSRKVYQRGMTSAAGGNVSVRIPDTERVLITRSGVSLGEATREDAVTVTLDGEVVEGQGKPSKEFRWHLAVYKNRPDVNAVVHGHPPYAVGYSIVGIELPLPTVTAQKLLGHVPVAKAAPSGSVELARNVSEVFENNPEINAILLGKHGICAVGPTLEEAYNVADLVEATAQQAFIAAQIEANLNVVAST